MVGADQQTLRYAITDLAGLPADAAVETSARRREEWLGALAPWSAAGIHFIQLREKILSAGELFSLIRDAMQILSAEDAIERPLLLLNGRADIAAAARADGVHLTAHPAELTPTQARDVFRAAGLDRCLVSVSCHTLRDAARARDAGADLILFGPVFEKRVRGEAVAPGTGLERLQQACSLAGQVPVLALGGVDEQTAPQCLRAGAKGVAGIRFFAQHQR